MKFRSGRGPSKGPCTAWAVSGCSHSHPVNGQFQKRNAGSGFAMKSSVPQGAAQKPGTVILRTHRHTAHLRTSVSLHLKQPEKCFENEAHAQIVISSAEYATHKILCSCKWMVSSKNVSSLFTSCLLHIISQYLL